MIRVAAFALIIISLFTRCTDSAYFAEFKSIKDENWHMDDVKHFEVTITDNLPGYNLILTLRNTTDYPYRNIYFFMTTLHPDSGITSDTLECLLADRYGRWLGKGMGKLRESSFLIRSQYRFPDTGTYVFSLEQAMRDEVLHGISDIGLRIEKEQ